jgi:hypothetical protein
MVPPGPNWGTMEMLIPEYGTLGRTRDDVTLCPTPGAGCCASVATGSAAQVTAASSGTNKRIGKSSIVPLCA